MVHDSSTSPPPSLCLLGFTRDAVSRRTLKQLTTRVLTLGLCAGYGRYSRLDTTLARVSVSCRQPTCRGGGVCTLYVSHPEVPSRETRVARVPAPRPRRVPSRVRGDLQVPGVPREHPSPPVAVENHHPALDELTNNRVVL